MSNTQYKNALDRKVKIFKDDFLNFSRNQFTDQNGKLIHAGEFGTSRENICKDLFESIVQKAKSIDTKGFVMNANDEITGEQDLIFYSTAETPVLTFENAKFFPVETIIAVGQIKSIIRTKVELEDALNKLAKIKVVRDNMGHDSVLWRGQDLWNGRNGYFKENPYDQVFTFLICEKIEVNLTPEDIDSLYDSAMLSHLKHNLILDLSNGIYGYRVKPQDPFCGLPFTNNGNSLPAYVKDDGNNLHIMHFLTNLQIATSGGTIFHPDMGVYLKK